MITYQTESLLPSLRDEIMPLLELHWHEIALNKDIPLSIDWEKYQQAYDAGNMLICTARDEGILIGYSVFFVHSHLHYKENLFAVQDILFIDPAYRNSRAGIGVIRFSEQVLKESGVSVVMHHMKTAHDFSPLMERLGYDFVEKIYSKRLN